MAKVQVADIAAMGFTQEMFGRQTEAELLDMVDPIITEQSALLSSRVSSAKYSSSDADISAAVTRAEKCLVAAEMIQARIIQIIGNANPNGEEPDTASLDRQKQKYISEANRFVVKVVNSVIGEFDGFVSGVNISAGTTRDDFLSIYK